MATSSRPREDAGTSDHLFADLVALADRVTVLVPCDPAHDTTAEIGSAIRRAAPLLRGHRLVVLAIWRSIAPAAGLARAALPGEMVSLGARNWDRQQQERARDCAQEAVAIAQECGLVATFEVRLGAAGWAANVAAIAGERGADVIVVPHARRVRGLARLLAGPRDGVDPPRSPLLLVAG